MLSSVTALSVYTPMQEVIPKVVAMARGRG